MPPGPRLHTYQYVLFTMHLLCCGAVYRLLQEQEAWMQLLAQYNAMTSSTPGAAEGAGNPSAPGAASPQHQQDAQGAEAAAGAEAEAPAGKVVLVSSYCHECHTTMQETAYCNRA